MPSISMGSVVHTRKLPIVPTSQAARNIMLEATAFGVASYIRIGSESTPPCLNAMFTEQTGPMWTSGQRE